MSFSLIVPAAGNKPEYVHHLPPVFHLNDKGIPLCIEALLGLDVGLFSSIFITILREHDELYGISTLLSFQLNRLGLDKAQVVILDKSTISQAETLYETIRLKDITGPVFFKDADCTFKAEIFPHNGVVVYPLEKLSRVNPQHKSYVAVDDMLYITNIIEKRVIDHYFTAGGYCFDDAEVFCKYYERYAGKSGLYLSHIVYSMLLDKYIFRPFIADSYTDLDFA